jgi:hypothetical protein
MTTGAGLIASNDVFEKAYECLDVKGFDCFSKSKSFRKACREA